METPVQSLLFPPSRKLSGGERLHSLRNCFPFTDKKRGEEERETSTDANSG